MSYKKEELNKEKEETRLKLVITAKELAKIDAEKEKIRLELVVTSKELAKAVVEKEQQRQEFKKCEEKYRALIDQGIQGVWQINERGLTTFISPQLKSILGYSSDEMLGKSFMDFMDKEAKKQAEKLFARRQKGISEVHEFRFKHKNGSDVFTLVSAMPILGTNEFNGATAYLIDITSKKKAEEVLNFSEKKYRSLFETSKSAIMTLESPTWKFTSGNKAMLLLFGAKNENEFISRAPWELSPKYQPDGQLSSVKAKRMIEKALKEGSNFFEWTHKKINGEKFLATVLLSRVDENGKHYLQATVIDITKKKKVEEALKQNEAKYRAIVETTSDYIFIVNKNLRIDSANNASKKIFGKKNIIGKHISDLFPRNIAKGYTHSLNTVFNSGKSRNSIDLLKFDHVNQWLEVNLIPLNNNKPEYVLGIARNITERKKIEDELKLSHANLEQEVKKRTAFLNSIVENIPHMIFVKDINSRFEEMNKSGELLLGLKKKDIIGKTLLEKFSKSQSAFFLAKDREVMQKKIILDIPEESIDTPRGTRILHTKKIPLFDESGKPLYLLGISEDITERKKSEEALKQAYEKLKEVEDIKSKFLTITSHELKTPLTPAKIQTQMLLEGDLGKLTEEQKQSFDIILRNINRLSKLIDDILEISSLKQEGFKLNLEKIQINEIIHEVVKNSGSVAKSKGLSVHLHLDNPPVLLLDRKRITEVITNLLDNAVKFTDKGSISIIVEKKEDSVLVKVKDTGIGIPSGVFEKLFHEFYQVDPSFTRAHGGTGLGLSVCKSIVEQHGGKMGIKSKVGEGSTFYFTLPLIRKAKP